MSEPAGPASTNGPAPSSPTARRARCPRCARPWPRGCLCAWLRPTANEVEVLLLQHPDEASHPKASVPLLAGSLERVQRHVGRRFDDATLHDALHGGGRTPWLLYPDVPAAPARAGVAEARPLDTVARARLRLVVIDGTWRKSLRLLLEHEALGALPRLSLAAAAATWPEAPTTSPADRAAYARLRPAPGPARWSTLEATCAALACLEDAPARYAPLLDAFAGFVADSLRAREGR